MIDIKTFRVDGIPSSCYYIPNFVTLEEEQGLLQNVNKAPKTKWVQLSNRRLQNWGGVPLNKGMIAEPIPDWLKLYVDRINSIEGIFSEGVKANHVLVNEYRPGDGILPHSDGPLFYPVISTISLGSSVVLDFYNPIDSQKSCDSTQFQDRYEFSIYIKPRSLLILSDQLYNKYLHGIKEIVEDDLNEKVIQPEIMKYGVDSNVTASDRSIIPKSVNNIERRDTRISLTIRHVPKTKKIKIKL